MWLLLCNNDYITWFHAWELISFTMEGVLVVVWGSLVDVCFDNLLLFYDFLSIASLALVLLVNYFTLSVTLVARSL
jgi:hypothetical protein